MLQAAADKARTRSIGDQPGSSGLRVLLVCAVALGLVVPAVVPAARAQSSDPAAQALIDRLRPVAGGPNRGIRIPGEASATNMVPTAPAPIWTTPTASTTAAPSRPAPPAAEPRPTLAAPRVHQPRPVRETTANAPSVSITITFPTGSATLTPEAERALAPLGRALSSPDLAPYRFRIEGHTDTVGDAASNQALSERRAAAVRGYLMQVFNVPSERLIAVGFGSSQLLIHTPPQTSETRNRRVQVVNLGN